jgi:8-oxo-dGTP pyrophosphatase MutT (NUDIX family)
MDNEKLIFELKQIASHELGFGRDDYALEGRGRAAVLALFHGTSFIESRILLILRSPDLVINPGQVALPGGGIEPGDEGDSIRTALRETFEEVGLESHEILPLGILPALPTVSGQFVVDSVLGVWNSKTHPDLTLQASEVAHAEWMSVRDLLASRVTEVRMVHGVEMELPVFTWGEQRMWGLTAMIFDLIRKRYDKLFS